MKINLIVSNCPELRLEGASKFQFLTENCYGHAVASGLSLERCVFRPSPVTSTQSSIDFIDNCLAKSLPLLAGKFDLHHGQGHDFWRKVLFFYLRDLIGSAYAIFAQIEDIFDPSTHALCIAALPKQVPVYGVSSTLDDAAYWGITDEGREYYAGEYFRVFYPGVFAERALPKKSFATAPTGAVRRGLLSMLKDAVKARLQSGSRRLRVMVTNAQYDQTLAKKVFLRSHGRASFHHVIPSLKNLYDSAYSFNPELRKNIATPLTASQDRFERYLGRCLETSLPWSLVEGFKDSYSFYRDFWDRFPNLKYVISENQYQQDALPRAVCALRGTEMVTLPHFFPLEIYATARLNRLRGAERFIARGEISSPSLAIGSGTVFPYRLTDVPVQKTIDTLYVTTDFYAYFQPLQQSADGCGYDVMKLFRQFVSAFLSELPLDVVEKVSIKKRPPPLLTSLQLTYPSAMSVLEPSTPAKVYMAKARLVLVEGMSTSLFESLVSDIPTIAFWPANLYHLDPAFEGYFSELEAAGIVFHDPCLLAKQVATVQADPGAWWHSPDIRKARELFLSRNLHAHGDIERLLLNLAGGRVGSLPQMGKVAL